MTMALPRITCAAHDEPAQHGGRSGGGEGAAPRAGGGGGAAHHEADIVPLGLRHLLHRVVQHDVHELVKAAQVPRDVAVGVQLDCARARAAVSARAAGAEGGGGGAEGGAGRGGAAPSGMREPASAERRSAPRMTKTRGGRRTRQLLLHVLPEVRPRRLGHPARREAPLAPPVRELPAGCQSCPPVSKKMPCAATLFVRRDHDVAARAFSSLSARYFPPNLPHNTHLCTPNTRPSGENRPRPHAPPPEPILSCR